MLESKNHFARRAAAASALVLFVLIVGAFGFTSWGESSPDKAITQKGILGDALKYGIVANTFDLSAGDAQTNVAAKTATCLTQTGNDLTKADSQEFLIGKVNQEFKVKGKQTGSDTTVVCPESEESKFVAGGNVHFKFVNRSESEIDAEIDEMINNAAAKAKEMSDKTPNATIEYGSDQKYHLDLTGSPAGTYYADLPADAMSQSEKMFVKKNSDQVLVLTNRTSGTFSMNKFNLNGKGTDQMLQPSGYEESTGIFYSLPNANIVDISGSITGTILAPKATVNVYSTSSGHMVADKVMIYSGEWHNIDQTTDKTSPDHPDEEIEKTSVKVSKDWFDKENQDGIRPDSIEVQLYADGEALDGKTVTLNDANNWSASFDDLDADKDGKTIAYTVKEKNVPDGYKSEVTGDAAKGFTITNTHETEKTSVSVSKVWADKNNQDGIRPESVEVQLYADGEAVDGKTVTLNDANNWSASFDGLDAKKAGKAIEYTVKEKNVPDGYKSEVTGDAAKGFTITNTHEIEKTSVSGTKTWVDQNNQDSERPDSITVRLHADGKEVASQTVSPDADGSWTYRFEGLDKYADGKKIAYTVTEDAVADYTTEVNGTDITNTHAVGMTSVTVSKVWADKHDQDGIRPDSVEVQLYADGQAVDGKTAALSDSNGWSATFSNLDAKKDGKAIEYTVKEKNIPDGYKSEVSGDAVKGFTITNTHAVKDNDNGGDGNNGKNSKMGKDVAETGDDSGIAGNVILFAAAAVGIAWIVRKRRAE